MLNILLVDDNLLITMMVEEWLEELGCKVVGPVASVKAALSAIEAAVPDGAILDVSLGNEDCYPVADALVARGVPFAFATGHGATSIAERFKGVAVLDKPFQFEDVKALIEKLS